MKVGSLFAGIGGFDLAAEWMGWSTIWQSEIDPYCVALLAERFPEARQLGDITAIDWAGIERPDILCGGFPCQDVSHAGPRTGIHGARSGLWFEFARAIRTLRPRYVVVENTPGLLDRGMGAVLGSLAELGYDAEWRVLSAGALGAPHLRERVWILAYPQHESDASQRGERAEVPGDGTGGRDDTRRGRDPVEWQESIRRSREAWTGFPDTPRLGPGQLRRRECTTQGATDWNLLRPWLQPEPRRVVDGLPAELDTLHRGTGNAIVPACVIPTFSRIAELEAEVAGRKVAA